MDDDFDDFDDDFLAAVDQLVAQHQGKGPQLTQPDSPTLLVGQQPSDRNLPVQPPTSLDAPVPQLATLQHTLPVRTPGNVAAIQLKPISTYSELTKHIVPVNSEPAKSSSAAMPVGRVSAVAAQLRSAPDQPRPTSSDPQSVLAQIQRERDRLQHELGNADGTNKLLRSNLEQAEKDRHILRC